MICFRLQELLLCSGKKSEDSSESSSGTLAYSLSDGESLSGGTYNAENEDESAIGAGGSVTASISGAAINKTAGDAISADSSSFEGVNAAVRVYDKATVSLEDCTITAEADNATGVFAYDGGTINISDSTEFTGEINSSGQTGTVSVTLGDDSKWILTGDSYISEFDGDIDNIVTNGFHVYVDGKELV